MGLANREVSKSMGDIDVKQMMKQVASYLLNAMEVNAKEIVYCVRNYDALLELETVFIPTDMPRDRVVFLKPRSVLESLVNVRMCVPRHWLTGMHADLMNLRNSRLNLQNGTQ